ncbi:Polysialic acid transport protein KpsD precursor [compost metagenome]
MNKPFLVAMLSLGLLTQPQAFAAEVFTLTQPVLPVSSPVRVSPEALEKLTPDQRRILEQRMDEVRPPASAEANAPEPPLEGDTSSIERMFAERPPEGISTRLRQYGYELFAESPSTFAPVEDMPVPEDYRVGPGDELVISVVSPRRSGEHTFAISRQGTIVYPGIGALSVSGMTYPQLVSFLEQRIRGGARDMNMSVRMGKLRTIRIFVVGNVKKPAAYTISALSSLSNAVMASGGPSKEGSLRNIQLKRDGKVIATFDYYDLLRRGDSSADRRLQSGDIIFVPPVGARVGVAGHVKTPAIYELKGVTSLKELLAIAGNVSPMGFTQRVQIERFDENRARKVFDVDVESAKGATLGLKDGDLIKIFPVNQKLLNAVTLEGHVERPGKYEFRPNLRLRDVIRTERDLKPESYMEFGMIERVHPPDFHMELIPFHLGKALAGDAAENKPLAPEDKIRVYYRWDIEELPTVRIAGAVQRAGEYRLHPKMKVSELLRLAGGLQDQADRSSAELTRLSIANNQVETRRMTIDLTKVMRGEADANLILEKNDYVLVKPIPSFKRHRTITLLGEVAQPGAYSFSDGETLFDILSRAGGFTTRSYLKGAIFTRESVKRQQTERLQDFVARLEANLHRQSAQAAAGALSAEAVSANQLAISSQRELLQSFKETKASGRMIVSLSDLARKPHSNTDVQLEDGDVLMVPPMINSVSVLGQVYNPTAITYEPGKRVSSYLSKTGGVTETADAQGIYVVKADGSVLTDKNFYTGWGPWRRGVMSAVLEPGDTVMVPERLAVDNSLRDIRDVTQIIFQVVTTAAITWGMLK